MNQGKLTDELAEEWNKNIDENEMIYNNYGNVCHSCAIYIALFLIAFLIIVDISSAYSYFQWYLKRINTETKSY